MRPTGKPVVDEERLLGDPVLRDAHRRRRRRDDRPSRPARRAPPPAGSRTRSSRRRSRTPAAAATAGSSYGGDQVLVGDHARRRRRIGVEHDRAIAHRGRRHHGVAAELPTTEHADRRRRGSDRVMGPSRRRVRRKHGRPAACSRRRAAVRVERGTELPSSSGEQRNGEQRRVRRAGLADRERRHRHAGRHLDDRVQRVLARTGGATARARRAPARSSWRRACPEGAPPHRHRR